MEGAELEVVDHDSSGSSRKDNCGTPGKTSWSSRGSSYLLCTCLQNFFMGIDYTGRHCMTISSTVLISTVLISTV